MTGRQGRTAPAVLTLRDLVAAVQAYARDDDESVAAIAEVLASGRIRLRPIEPIAGPRIRLVPRRHGGDRHRPPRPAPRPVQP